MGLGDIVGGLIKGDSSQKSNLQGFLNKFNSSAGLYASTIDPLNTFDVEFQFYPKLDGSEDKRNTFGRLADMGRTMGTRAIDNLTGGLVGQLVRDINGDVFQNAKDSYKSSKDSLTFIDYLARGNMFVTDDRTFSGVSDVSKPQLKMNLSYYVQEMTLPQIIQKDESNLDTMVGNFPINGKCVVPSSQEFQMQIINTKQPLMEKIFYPWMREVTLPVWTYNTQPYTTADILVSMEKHADVKYMFLNCRPKNIATYTPTNDLGSLTRSITFVFDYMFITSNNKVADSTMDRLGDVAKGALNGIGTTLGL